MVLALPLPAQSPLKPESVPRAGGFQAILWWRGGQPGTSEFFAGVRRAGFTGVSVSGGQDPAVVKKAGLAVYGDQLGGKGILELREKTIRPIFDRYTVSRDDADLIRPAVLSSSDCLTELTKKVSHRLDTLLPQEPIAVSLADEASITRHANPLDLCFSPTTLRGFQAFVRARFRRIDALNAAWGTEFTSFDAVRPFTADGIRARELGGGTYPANLSPWAAHREFMDAEFARLIRRVSEQVQRAAPGLPAGLTGMPQPSAYGGHDYGRLMPGMTFYEVYDIGGSRDLAMSLAAPGARQMATLFPLAAGEDPRMVTARLADMLAHGMWGVVVWSSDEVMTRNGQLRSLGRVTSEALASLRGPAAWFAGAELERSPVWMVESQPSVRAWWMLDSRRDGDSWIKRLSSYEKSHSTSVAARSSWIRLFEDLGLQPRLVPAADLPARLLAQPPRLLVLPATLALSDAEATAIRSYVERGGILVADHSPGLYDQRLRFRGFGALDDLFGIHGRTDKLSQLMIHEGEALGRARLRTGPAAAEDGLGAEIADPVSGFHVQLEHPHGRGRAFYLNLAVCEYDAVRLDPRRLSAAKGLRKRLRHVLREAKVVPPVLLESKGMPTCLERAVLRGAGGRRLLAIRVNALAAPAILAELGKRGPYTLRLTFPVSTGLVDLGSGKTYPSEVQHDLPLDPYAGLFLELRR